MSARLGVDFLLLEARELVIGNSPPRSDFEPVLQIVPDVELTVKLLDMLTGDNVVVTAHADWVAGYPAAGGIAVSFLALHAKTPAEFSGLYVQLVTALGNSLRPATGRIAFTDHISDRTPAMDREVDGTPAMDREVPGRPRLRDGRRAVPIRED